MRTWWVTLMDLLTWLRLKPHQEAQYVSEAWRNDHIYRSGTNWVE